MCACVSTGIACVLSQQTLTLTLNPKPNPLDDLAEEGPPPGGLGEGRVQRAEVPAQPRDNRPSHRQVQVVHEVAQATLEVVDKSVFPDVVVVAEAVAADFDAQELRSWHHRRVSTGVPLGEQME